MELGRLTPILLPTVTAEWLTLLIRIRKVPGSNLGQGIGYPD
jgi:hypothetical protein